MLFNSYEFIFFFLPVTAAAFFLAARFTSRNLALAILVVASLFYYGWWKWSYLGLIVGSIIFNYGIGYLIEPDGQGRPKRLGKLLLIFGVSCNLGVLGYFKYANFLVENWSLVSGGATRLHDITLPLAISFFTFQQIAYLVDAYRGATKEHSFLHYCLFVTFFPQLIAGPIVHHKEMLPQFARDETYRARTLFLAVGVSAFVIGLFKKVIFADSLALYATPVFGMADLGGAPGFSEAWVGALAYTFQLYFDFSGYSDMAMGLAFMFGVRLPLNFDSPYKAVNIIDFWRRWHITLSRFLRDYLYIPLGGNRRGKTRRYANLIITMLLGGLWHGAGWTFVAWGALHGFYLVINHTWQRIVESLQINSAQHFAYTLGARALTFLSVVVAWVFFRAETFGGALRMLAGMVGLNGSNTSDAAMGLLPVWLAVSFSVVWLLPNTFEFTSRWNIALDSYELARQPSVIPAKLSLSGSWSVGLALMFVYALIEVSTASEFLYFNF